MKEYFAAWHKYVQFSGTATRPEFWWFFLINLLISAVLTFMEVVQDWSWKMDALYSVLTFLPMLSLTVRRLRDSNHSAWWLFSVCVPAIGIPLLLFLLALPSRSDSESDSGDNNLLMKGA